MYSISFDFLAQWPIKPSTPVMMPPWLLHGTLEDDNQKLRGHPHFFDSNFHSKPVPHLVPCRHAKKGLGGAWGSSRVC